MCVCVRSRTGAVHSKEHSCVLAGDMLIASDINLKNISRSNTCLRLHLQPCEQRGTDTHRHTRAQTHANRGKKKVGQVKQATAFQRQPAMCDVLKKQVIVRLVETLRLNLGGKKKKLWSRFKLRKDSTH